MSKFSLYIDGLSDLQNKLEAGQLNKKAILALGSAIELIHRELSFSIKNTYTTRKTLDSVRIGKRTTSSVQQGINNIILGLEYRGDPIPLQDFALQLGAVSPVGVWIPTPNLFMQDAPPPIKPREKVIETVAVKVLRKGNFTKSPNFFRGYIKRVGKLMVLRKEDPSKGTWIKKPSIEDLAGKRQPYKQLYGPSLPIMAEQRLLLDPKVKALIENIPNKLAEVLAL